MKTWFLLFLLIISFTKPAFAQATIVVQVDSETGEVNRSIAGTAILGWEINHGRKEKKKYWMGGDYGYGIWDAQSRKFHPEALELLKTAGIKTIRFIGQFTGWEKSVGDYHKRKYKFGVDEQIELSKELNAEPVLCLQNLDLAESYLKLAEYLRLHHPGVCFIEIGNESWFILSPEEYANRYRACTEAMKRKHAGLKFGIVGHTLEWDEAVIKELAGEFDFIAKHYYPNAIIKSDPLLILPKDLFMDTFESITRLRYVIQKTNTLMSRLSSLRPIFVTEFNVLFEQDRPAPYRHSLGAALVNAELIKLFQDPQMNILYAHYWQFLNEYTGAVSNNFDGTLRSLMYPYFKRPNYYVLFLYSKHFGDIRVANNLTSDGYALKMPKVTRDFVEQLLDGIFVPGNLLYGVAWETNNVNGISVSDQTNELIIEFNNHQQWNYFHVKKVIKTEPSTYYRLSGYIKTENLIDDIGVSLEVQDARGWDKTHSASMTEKTKGTTDWRYVETLYQTLPDADSIRIIIRRNGLNGPCKGKAYFKDIKIEKLIPSIPDKIPYLSVNASKSSNGDKVYLMVINKNMDAPMTTIINLKNFTPADKGNAWVLNGPSVDATNEQRHDNVKIAQHGFEIKGNPFEFTFEPHSLTAIEIERSIK